MKRLLLAAGLGLALGLLVMWGLRPDPEVRYRNVEVPVEVLVKSEPDTIIRWQERIITREVEAEQVATAPAAALPDVSGFCGAAGWLAPGTVADSLPTPAVPPYSSDPRLLIRSFAFRDGELQAWGPRSDGDLWSGRYRVSAPFEARVSGDSLFVTTDRWAGLKEWGGRALWAGAGAVAGYVVTQF